jgi:apolipoprotein N-acyltransferase
VFVYDGGHISDITPAAYVAGRVDSQPGAGYGGGLYGAGLYGVPTYWLGVVLEAASGRWICGAITLWPSATMALSASTPGPACWRRLSAPRARARWSSPTSVS